MTLDSLFDLIPNALYLEVKKAVADKLLIGLKKSIDEKLKDDNFDIDDWYDDGNSGEPNDAAISAYVYYNLYDSFTSDIKTKQDKLFRICDLDNSIDSDFAEDIILPIADELYQGCLDYLKTRKDF